MATRLVWLGAQVSRRVKEASAAGINETIEAAADQAASGRSGSIAAIRVVERARPGSLVGRWGLPPEPRGDPFYELFHETGTAYIAGDNAKRRAADGEYRKLPERIARHLAGSGGGRGGSAGPAVKREYVTRAGRTIMATDAQIAHWTRGSRQ